VIEIEELSKLTGIFTGRSGEEEEASGILPESSDLSRALYWSFVGGILSSISAG
jgi:hypothetical protein